MNNLIDEFKAVIKKLKPTKPFTEKFWKDIENSKETRYEKCKEEDKKRNKTDWNKRFDI